MAHLSTSSTCPTSTSSPGTRAATAARPARAATARASPRSVRDVQTFVDHIGDAHGFAIEDIAVVAQSVGAVLVADLGARLRAAHPLHGARLAGVQGQAVRAVRARRACALMHKLRGNFFVNSYVKAKFLTHDPERIASYDADPLITRADLGATPARPVRSGRARRRRRAGDRRADAAADLRRRLGRAPRRRSTQFFDRLGSDGQGAARPAGLLSRHAGRARPRAGRRARCARSCCASSRSRSRRRTCATPTSAAPRARKSDALAAPLPPLSPRGLYWAPTRAGLRLGGALSRRRAARPRDRLRFRQHARLRLPQPAARASRRSAGSIDRNYLDSIGWRGIRQRKVHLEELLREAIADRRAAGAPVRIVDIAAGHGRYVLDAIDQRAARCPTRSCCATTASSTSSRAAR